MTQQQADKPLAPQKQQPVAPSQAAALEGAEVVGGLRQIQKILVEPRLQQIQTALDALDARRQKDLADLRKEVDRSVSRSDDFIKKESSTLDEGLLAEKHERIRQVEDRSHELEARLRAIEERIGKVEERLTAEARALRQTSLEQHRQYADELRNWRDEMAKAIARDLTGLRAEKADRAVLARLLSEVGDRLSGTEPGGLSSAAVEPTQH